MRVSCVVAAFLLAAVGLLGASRADARSTAVNAPIIREYLPGADATLSVCTLGETGQPVSTLVDTTTLEGTIYFGEGDTYYTYIELRPDSCLGCGDGYAGALGIAHLVLYFPFAPETLTVNVSVARNAGYPCRQPYFQDAGGVICEPFGVRLTCETAGVYKDFGIPFPPGCSITALQQIPPDNGVKAPAFLAFEFVSANDVLETHKPQIAVQLARHVCKSYNPVGFIPYDVVLNDDDGNPVMYVDIAQCENVGTKRKTWGELKLRYR